jgi:uncharacterized protein YcnI
MNPRAFGLVVLGCLLVACLPAQAHITIDSPAVMAGTYARLVLRVTHGCQGSPTKAVSVYLPEAFRFAKAKVKQGWTISYEKANLARPVQSHGRSLTETTAVIRWEGGQIPDDQFDEFVLTGRVDESASGRLPLRVLQECEQGQTDWQGAPDSKAPAPALEVKPAKSRPHR